MKKLFAALLLGLGMSGAAALELPGNGEVVAVTTEGNAVVGVGVLAGGILELELENGYEGFAHLLIVDRNGAVESVEVMIGANGNVIATLDDEFTPLDLVLARAGVELTVSATAELPVLPDVVSEVQDRGEQAVEAAREKAYEARENAAAGEVEAEAAVGLETATTVANEAAEEGLDQAKAASEDAGPPELDELGPPAE